MSFEESVKDFFMPWRKSKWVQWHAVIDIKTCSICRNNNGRIMSSTEAKFKYPVHLACRCSIESMDIIMLGYATIHREKGADYLLRINGKLPDVYLTKQEASMLGWKKRMGNLAEVAPGKIIGGDIYDNRDGRLPKANGRIWYEADINYVSGHRGKERILYSNDGLIFVTYDHYKTFYEIGEK